MRTDVIVLMIPLSVAAPFTQFVRLLAVREHLSMDCAYMQLVHVDIKKQRGAEPVQPWQQENLLIKHSSSSAFCLYYSSIDKV